MPADAAPVHLHQIAYSPATLAALEPGYLLLDNLDNPRPDWFEYAPIRRHLTTRPLDEQAWYGFFSPKFGSKTQLDHAAVVATVRAAAAAGADVALFSPQPDMGAFFLNVFEQGETFDPGFIDAAQAWLAHAGHAAPPLRTLVMDASQVVFSNYFVARPPFWRAWLALNETLWAACEGPPSALRDRLTAPTSYGGGVQRKVFLMERTASLLLATRPWRGHAANPFTMGWSGSRLREHPLEAVISDALKLAHRERGYPHYLQAFAALRQRTLGAR